MVDFTISDNEFVQNVSNEFLCFLVSQLCNNKGQETKNVRSGKKRSREGDPREHAIELKKSILGLVQPHLNDNHMQVISYSCVILELTFSSSLCHVY